MLAGLLGPSPSLTSDAAAAPLTLDIAPLLLQQDGGSSVGSSTTTTASSSNSNSTARKARASDLLQQRFKALQGALGSSVSTDTASLLRAIKAATSPLVNEGHPVGARAADRIWQLNEINAVTRGL